MAVMVGFCAILTFSIILYHHFYIIVRIVVL